MPSPTNNILTPHVATRASSLSTICGSSLANGRPLLLIAVSFFRASERGAISYYVHILAKYLNGRGIGARYDGTYPGSTRVGSCTGLTGQTSSFSASYKTFLRQFWEAQADVFETGQGWIQWVCCFR